MPLDRDQRHNALALMTRLAREEQSARATLADAVRRGLPLSLEAAVTVALQEGNPMSDVLSELAADPDVGLDLLIRLWELLPSDTTSLRMTAVKALQQLTETTSLPEDPVVAVSMLADRADRLVEAGVYDPSVAIARQAIERLAEPDHPSPELASLTPNAWRVMSRCQQMTGDTDGAVASARLALRLTKVICWDAPCPSVANAHATLATRLNAAGRETEALVHFETAITMAERLLENRFWYLPEHDEGPPGNLLYRHDDAIQAYALARAGLAADWGFDPERTFYITLTSAMGIIQVISSALTGLCSCLSGLEDFGGAAKAAERAVTLMRDEYDADPDRHRWRLGLALTQLSEQLGRLGQGPESLRAAEEAAELLRKAVLDSGGAFVDEYAQALSALLSATELSNETIGPMLDCMEELILLYESARGMEALGRGSPVLTAIAMWLDGYAREAERIGDLDGALDIVALAIRGAALMRGIDDEAEAWLAALVNLRSRLLSGLGRTEEAIAAAEEAVSFAEGTTRLVVLNNLAKRLLDSGNLERAGQVARQTLVSLEPAAVAGDIWWLAVSLLGISRRTGSDKLPSAHHIEIVRQVLASAPSPPSDAKVEKNLPYIALHVVLALAEGSPAEAMEILQQLAAAGSRAELPADVRADYATLIQRFVCVQVDARKPDFAACVYEALADIASASDEEVPRVEQAKAATEVVQAFLSEQRYEDAADIAADAEEVLRSPAYLAARERDLGQKPAEFLQILDQILGL